MKNNVICNVIPCSQVAIYRHSRTKIKASIFMVEEDKQTETVVSSETLVNNIRSQKMVIFEICDSCTVITFAAVHSYLQ